MTGNAAADFMLGFPSLSQTPDGILPVQYRQRTYAFYVQDEWKTTRNLTINLGARFDYVGIVFEKNGLPRGLRLDKPGGYLYPEDPNSKSIVHLYDPTVRIWPRVGLAYRPSENTVIRLGGGVYNNVNQMNNLTVVGNPLKVFSVSIIADPANPNGLTLQNPYPINQQAAKPPLNVVSVPTDRVEAYNVQWSASVERKLSSSTSVEIAYVGHDPLAGGRWKVLLRFAATAWGAALFARILLPDVVHVGSQHRYRVRHQRIPALHARRRSE